MSGSRIFRRNRALGYVSNHVPALVRYIKRRRDYLITTCVGRSFQIYTAGNFRLLHVGPIHSDEITCMATDKFFIYTACDKVIYAWKAGKHMKHVLKGHNKNVHLLLPFRAHLAAVDEENVFKLWNLSTETVYLEIPFKVEEFKITALSHPPTYLNKLLFGSEQGSMQLWNIKENKLIHSFASRGSKITALEHPPAKDVVAIGMHSGKIVLLNLLYDEVVMEFNQDWGPVTKISFRTDGYSIMATSSTNGNVVLWDLDERKVHSQFTAHHESVTSTVFLAGEPLMLTTSPDNSMKLWIFDKTDGGARLLRIREGHSSPPLCIRYHGAKGEHILSSGEDSSLRVFSTVSETLNRNMGRASYNRKLSKKKNRFEQDILIMPPIIEFTSESTRDKEWDSIAAIHAGIIQTTTWSFDKVKMGDLKLVPEKFQNKNRTDFNSEASCLTLTHCGNFVIIGYTSGDVERFNIQSGIHRASYGKPAHKCAVRGVACDNLNQIVITGGSDGLVKFWHFKGNVSIPLAKLKMTSGINFIRSHRESSMLCIALEDFVVYVLDCDTKTIVRKFSGHTAKINDATFSPDSRWLITAAMDLTVKIWDVPSSYLVDHFRVERACISLTMSPTGNFLATAHTNSLGIYLWANKTLFNHISLRSIDPFEEAPYIDLPSHLKDESTIEDAINDLKITDGEELDVNYNTPNQLSNELITLSGLAASRWQNLLDLDIIKKRNKPIAPPKTQKQAPFFLPTVAGIEFKFDLTKASSEQADSKVKITKEFNNLTTLGRMLEETYSNENYQDCVDYLKKLGPSMIDFEIKSLHPVGGGNHQVMRQFLELIIFMFDSNSNFELASSYLGKFLQTHGLVLAENRKMLEYLQRVEKAQIKSWANLEGKFLQGLGVVTALRNTVG